MERAGHDIFLHTFAPRSPHRHNKFPRHVAGCAGAAFRFFSMALCGDVIGGVENRSPGVRAAAIASSRSIPEKLQLNLRFSAVARAHRKNTFHEMF